MFRIRRVVALALAGFAIAASCKETGGPFVPVVTTIAVAPATRAFTSLQLAVQFNAVVRDQRGNQMGGQTVTWGTSNGTVATVNGTGVVTSQAVGSANIIATIGTITDQAEITVTQVPASLLIFEGNAQSAPVGTAIALPIVVRVVDSAGTSVAGIAVGFAATAGGGSVGTPSATANGQGRASTTWTLGTTSGTQSVTASSAGIPSILFNATGLPLAADTVIKESTDGQTVPAGTGVSPAPAVRVRDQHGNPVPGVTVTFAVTQGGGLVTGGSVSTNASGIATVGSWVVGSSGTQELSATATGGGIGGNPITFTASVQAPGAPTSIAVSSGNNQTGLIGSPVNFPPAAIVRDATSNPVQGVTVTFAVTAGGGSITGGTAITDLQGIAQVGSWTINAGTNTLTASVAGIVTPATFTATGTASAFNIVVRYPPGSTPSPGQSAAFDSAAARWSRVIFGDLPSVNVNINGSSCGGAGLPVSSETIDDVLIFALLVPIDGPGGVLGSAGPCSIRTASGLTTYGLMRFDTDDLATMEGNGSLRDVILHEMGHVLGLGTLWTTHGLITGAGQVDVYFTGAQARAAFDSIGGTGFTGGGKVPIENCVAGVPPSCGPGTQDGHWREFTFEDELMTGYIDLPAPLSIVTAAQFGDMGYQVNLDEADAFTVSFPLLRARTAGTRIHLKDDMLRIPIEVTDESGRVIRVIPAR